MKVQLAELARVVHGATTSSASGTAPPGDQVADRRSLLKRGAVLATGAVAGGAGLLAAEAQPAAAITPSVLLGTSNDGGANTTSLISSASQTLSLGNGGTGVALDLTNSGMVVSSQNGTVGVSSHSSRTTAWWATPRPAPRRESTARACPGRPSSPTGP